MSFKKNKEIFRYILIKKLIVTSLFIGFLCSFLALSLKHTTEYLEDVFFLKAEGNSFCMLVFPLIGLSAIHFFRQYLFKKKENKGIMEIFEALQSKHKSLPFYKIPSHFINGLLTVAFGGSTGIEVSTVVATAAISDATRKKATILRKYKTELICAGVAAGITILFSSPIAGILFSMEVISKKRNAFFFMTTTIAVTIASLMLLLLKEAPLFSVTITTWHFYALPYFIILGVLSGIHSVYLTKLVIFFKSLFGKIRGAHYKIILGALLLGLILAKFPPLYGDGYSTLKEALTSVNPITTIGFITTLIGLVVLKPIATSLTLASGGDGGVFAPSLFMGAFLGLLLATVLNTFFNANVIPVNFMVIGMAAVLSANIHAPFTALFLVCGMINDYTLFFPILMVSLIAKATSKMIFPFTVYTYAPTKFVSD